MEEKWTVVYEKKREKRQELGIKVPTKNISPKGITKPKPIK